MSDSASACLSHLKMIERASAHPFSELTKCVSFYSFIHDRVSNDSESGKVK